MKKRTLDSLSKTPVPPAPAPTPEKVVAVAPEGKAIEKAAPKPAEEPVVEEVHAGEHMAAKPATEALTSTPAAPEPGTDAAAKADSYAALFPEPTVAIAAPPSWIWWFVLLIFSLILGIVGYGLARNKLTTWLSVASPTPTTASASATPSPSTSPSAAATATPTPTATPTSTPSPTATPGVTISSITMRVLNGTTASGAASKVRTTLENAGFTVRTIGNAKSQDYAHSIIYYASGRLAEAQAVQAALSLPSSDLTESSLSAPDMVLIVVGR